MPEGAGPPLPVPREKRQKGDFEDADYILASICKIGKPEMDRAKNLKLIHVPATGYNHVDIAYAKEKGHPGVQLRR